MFINISHHTSILGGRGGGGVDISAEAGLYCMSNAPPFPYLTTAYLAVSSSPAEPAHMEVRNGSSVACFQTGQVETSHSPVAV